MVHPGRIPCPSLKEKLSANASLASPNSLLSFNVLCFWLLQNELALLEFLQLVVETMHRHFGNVASPRMPRMMSFYPMLMD
ncbi:hypothetical protein Peur_068192 [Populus x canadensis]